ncbi:MAG: S8 family serine peptidase, partial [Verrucomicrobia bacterium]|nr:S8 family serine peptidase [Verrucomicrobiota bacterium]
MRIGEIATGKAASALAARPAAPSASGLYLVQFAAAPSPEQRQQLREMGVELLRYVPDDAFIARFKNVSPTKVESLAFVRWVGPYEPAYKIHPKLAATAAQAAKSATSFVSASILLSPEATPKEILQTRAALAAVTRQSRLRQGTVISGTLTPRQLTGLAQSGAVLWIEPATKRKLHDEAASKLIGGDDGEVGTPTLTQQQGFDGSGVTVSVADTGLDSGDTNTMTLDLRGRVRALLHYGDLLDAADEHSHGTHVAGIVAGNA